MSQTVTLPDELYDRLQLAADQRGISVERFIDEVVGVLGPGSSGPPSAAQDDELLLAATRALLDGTDPPIPIDWDEVSRCLVSSEPEYATIEDAMGTLRQRLWVKDD
jgi:hypothetical protein